MLTIEEYSTQFGKCYGSFATNLAPGIRLIKEGLLQFTPESAACWGGPFKGGYAQFCIKDHSKELVACGLNKGKLRLPIADEERKERRIRDQRKATFTGFRAPRHGMISAHMGYPTVEFPVRLWMMGNDDTSYSKCYRTEKEALDELDLFIDNEPLDFKDVICGFEFVFTN